MYLSNHWTELAENWNVVSSQCVECGVEVWKWYELGLGDGPITCSTSRQNQANISTLGDTGVVGLNTYDGKS